jgi:hypothetical protein
MDVPAGTTYMMRNTIGTRGRKDKNNMSLGRRRTYRAPLERKIFSRSCIFAAKNELNPVKFVWNYVKFLRSKGAHNVLHWGGVT